MAKLSSQLTAVESEDGEVGVLEFSSSHKPLAHINVMLMQIPAALQYMLWHHLQTIPKVFLHTTLNAYKNILFNNCMFH